MDIHVSNIVQRGKDWINVPTDPDRPLEDTLLDTLRTAKQIATDKNTTATISVIEPPALFKVTENSDIEKMYNSLWDENRTLLVIE